MAKEITATDPNLSRLVSILPQTLKVISGPSFASSSTSRAQRERECVTALRSLLSAATADTTLASPSCDSRQYSTLLDTMYHHNQRLDKINLSTQCHVDCRPVSACPS